MRPHRPISTRGWVALTLALWGLSLACRSAANDSRPALQSTPPGAVGSPGADLRGGDPTLAAGVQADLDLIAGTVWEATLAAAGPTYVELVVEQRSLDVSLTVRDADGRIHASADGPSGIGIDERLAAELPAGVNRLRLEPRSDGPESGRVRLRVEALRPWTASDPRRIELLRIGQEATHLDGSDSQEGWLRARELSRIELTGWRELGDAAATIRTLNRLSSLERELGELVPAIAHGREAVALSLTIADPGAEAATRYWLAQALNRDGQVDAARAELARGLQAAELAGDLRLQGRILNWQGRLESRDGDLEAAKDLFLRALDLRSAAHDVRGITSMLNNVAVIEQHTGDNRRALEYFRRAVDVARRLRTPGAELLALSNTAGLLEDRGQWQEALDTLYETLDRSRAVGDRRREADSGRALASVLVKLGESTRARALLERALEIERERKESYYQLATLIALGWLYIDQAALADAEQALDEALDLSRRQQSAAAEANVLRAMARVRLRQDLPDEALVLLARARRLLAGQRPFEIAKVLRDVAEVELQGGSAAQAEETLSQAVAALGELEAPELRFAITYQQARAAHALGEPDRAHELAQFALGIAEALRSSVDDPDLRAVFLSRVREAYGFAVDVLLELHRREPEAGWDRQAFVTLERAKARSLVELLSAARSGAETAVDAELLEAERAALGAVNRARHNLETSRQTAPQADHGEMAAALGSARRRLAAAEAAIRHAAPRYAALRYASPITVDDLQARLDDDSALLEFHLRPQRSVVFVVTRHRFAAVPIAGEEALAPWAAGLLETLVHPNRRSFGQLQQRARMLGALLLEDAIELAGDRLRWIVVPEGPLSYLPFEVLRVAARDGTGRDQYLVEQRALSYAPSAGVLLTLDAPRSPRAGAGLIVFADPTPPDTAGSTDRPDVGRPMPPWPRLPGARREVDLLAAAMPPGSVLSFVDSEASEARLKSEPLVGSARWLHLASHAWVDEATPASSAVVLAADALTGEDGYLTVREIFALELSAELVVLSGCETALGRQVRGEGLIGLTRAFLYAGAGGLQVSLWKVADDTTPALMSSFYGFLRQGQDPADAIRHAKLASLRDPRRAHPFHWAPFVLIGGLHRNAEGRSAEHPSAPSPTSS